MNPCDACLIEEKLHECCGRHPETGVRVLLELGDGRRVSACPHLSGTGSCLVYDRRPYGCRLHECGHFAHQAPGGRGCDLLAAMWGPEEEG